MGRSLLQEPAAECSPFIYGMAQYKSPQRPAVALSAGILLPSQGSRMKWVTREHVHVDRMACPWLIRRFIDASAEFMFVPAADVDRVAKAEGATPFDVPGCEFGHHEEFCSFDAIMFRHKLQDEALFDLAAIVRAADTEDFEAAPEAIGLRAITWGASMMAKDDHEAVDKGMYIFDSLYAHCKLRHLRERHAVELEPMDRAAQTAFLKERLHRRGMD